MRVLAAPTIELLQGLDALAGISREELDSITDLMERQLFDPGEILINESDAATQFYILIQGKLDVVKQLQDGTVELLNVIEQPGELFGEMALVEDKPRSAGIIAGTESEVLVIHKDGFLGLVNHFPLFTLEVAKSISNYLRRTDATLIGSLEAKNRELEKSIAELHETRQTLIKHERLSTIGRMASTILHDLKNPMTTISGFAQLIGMRDLPRDEVIKYTALISDQVSQFNALAHELLTFAKGGTELHFQPQDFPGCLQRTFTTVQFNLAQQKMQLDLNLESQVQLNIDADRFGRVIENLAKNAAEAMEPGGILTIESVIEKGQLILKISDTGYGMEPQVSEKVFDEFFTHHKEGGTGLGLAIVKGIVTDHQGLISVESTPGKGTAFTIALPILKIN